MAITQIVSKLAVCASRDEYLQDLIDSLREWTGCHAVGVRVLGASGESLHSAYIGFDDDTWHPDEPLPVDRYPTSATVPIRLGDTVRAWIRLGDDHEIELAPSRVAAIESAGPLIGFALERFQLDDALALERHRAERLLDPLAAASHIIGEDHEVKFCSPAILKRRGPVAGRRCYEYFNDRKSPCPWCKLPDTLAGESAALEWRDNATGRLFRRHDSLVQCADGTKAKLTVVRDVTDRVCVDDQVEEQRARLEALIAERSQELARVNKKLRAEIAERLRVEETQAQLVLRLEALNRELDDFADVVSHDLRAPLRAVHTLVDWLSRDYADRLDSRGKQQIGIIVDRMAKMDRLVETILQYSRAGADGEDRAEVDLNETVAQAIELVGPPPHVTVISEKPLPKVVGDKTRLQQVFQNLVGNAVQSIDKDNGLVRIGWSEDGGWFMFRVEDNGRGLDETRQKRLSTGFQASIPPVGIGGMGLGLAIVLKNVRRYGGTVWVKSKHGEGTVFYFTIRKVAATAVETGSSGNRGLDAHRAIAAR